MPSFTANPTSSAPAPTLDSVVSVAPAVSTEAVAKDLPPPATSAPVSAAHYAVETALAVADRATSSGQRSVSLQFSVSGVDLSVRVELRGDVVHTTFRTDSPELRNALAHEWQAVASDGQSDRAQRLAEPVFTPAAGGNSTAANTTADQRDSGARQQQPSFDDFANARAAARVSEIDSNPPASVGAPATALRPTPLPVPGRLNAFA